MSDNGSQARPMSHVLPATRTPREPLRAPVRTCVGCRSRDLRSDLVRLVARTDDDTAGAASAAVLVVDVGRSLPGRGAWLHPRMRCLELAERRHAFTRALRLRSAPDASDVRRFLVALGAE
ncbi:YlxR family protein [Luteimicrobium sp. DT211]|uniref:YlxR family protein n=1 Tax=Luteimicrobium sp. DT211 TaxID=3393412 RepID=UPI003CED6845